MAGRGRLAIVVASMLSKSWVQEAPPSVANLISKPWSGAADRPVT